jgi:putative oxidoreductase
MKKTQDAAALAGRIMLALMFVISGLGKIGAFADTTGYMASADLPAIDPLLEALLIITVLVELGAGAAIVFGWKTRQATVAIFVVTALVTVMFHRFWEAPPDQAIAQQLMFMKNLAGMGGLLVLGAFGPGEYALDEAYRHKARKHLPASTAGSF